jgi:uncharacterized protein (TIGR00297 family)
MALTAGELKRKLLHIAVGGFAFLLRDLEWPAAVLMAVAAFAFNWQLMPRIGGRGMWREPEHGAGYPLGILLYPLSVLGLVLVFRHDLWMAAAIWGVLALGDGMASILGQAMAGPRLPWNPRKGWIGFAAFVVFGTTGAGVLTAWTLRLPVGAWASPSVLAVVAPLAVICALVESMPTALDDNLTVPIAGACVIPLLAMAEPALLFADPGFAPRLALGLAINAVIAAAAWKARSIDGPGAVSAIVIGTLITAALDLAGLAVMVAFFIVGSSATRVGYRVKAARGIAQEKGGARGWRNAWANGGVAAALALMAAFTAGEARAFFVLAYAAAVATAAADTCSSEIGKAYGRRTFLITTLRPVPPGTEGAISLEGTLGGLAGGAIIAAVGAATGLYAPAWAPAIAAAGLLGSLAESVIGSVAEKRGWLDNDLLNALNTAIGAGIVMMMAKAAA